MYSVTESINGVIFICYETDWSIYYRIYYKPAVSLSTGEYVIKSLKGRVDTINGWH